MYIYTGLIRLHRLDTFIPNGLNDKCPNWTFRFTFVFQAFFCIMWILTAIIWTSFPDYS